MIARWPAIVSVLSLLGPGAVALALVVAATLAPADVVARDMRGKGGIGTLVPTSDVLGSTPVIALRYWRRSLAIEAAVGFDWWRDSLRTDDTRRIHAGAGATFLLIDAPRLSAGVTTRAWLQFGSRIYCSGTPCKQVEDKDLGLLLEALFSVEYFFSDHFGVSAAVGPALFVASSFAASADNDAGLKDLLGDNLTRGGALIELGGRYSGGIGILYYF